MQRVAVVGSSGAGKTTLARQLGRRLGLPVVSLDAHYWRPGWQRPDGRQWRDEQAELLSGGAWIADGNYWSTLDMRLQRCDTVVFVDLPRRVCLLRAVRRVLRHHGRALQADGCPERFSPGFFRYIWTYPQRHRPRLLTALGRTAPGTRVLQLRSRRQVLAFRTDPW